MNLEEFEIQYRDAIDETLNQLQTVVLMLAQLQIRITNVGLNLQDISQTVEAFVTEQMLDSNLEPVPPDQINQFQLTRLPELEILTPESNSPSPVVYPSRPPKGRKSLAAIELPTFAPISPKHSLEVRKLHKAHLRN